MSLFFQSDSQLKSSLQGLPESYTNQEITAMVDALLYDIASSDREFDNFAGKVMHFSEQHKKLCLAFPMLFRGIVKGSFTRSMLDIFLSTRRRVENKQLSKEQAINHLTDMGVQILKTRDSTR